MIPILFVHGWGFDAGFWKPLIDRLPDFPTACVDMGFFGQPAGAKFAKPLVVGHSMGFAWALANLPRPWAGAVSINGFSRFTRAQDFVEGSAPRLIERMAVRFRESPRDVAAEFLTRCGVTEPALDGMAAAPLGEALDWLAACDERAALAALDCPLLAFAGGRDQIVTDNHARAAFRAHDLTIVEEAAHLLPWSHPDWLAGQLRAFAARLP